MSRNELIKQNMNIVDEIINTIKFKKFPTVDEIQELKSVGYLALVEAVDSFSAKLNVPLNFWIKENIRWAIYKFFGKEKKEEILDIEKDDLLIECRLSIKNALHKLSESEQDLIKDLVFFGMTQSEVAKKHNISQQAISKKYIKIIKKLRKYIGS